MLKVIVADDEERICKLICTLVDYEAMGMRIEGIAHNGVEALDLMEKIHPDILITDIRMPGLNGLELMEQVKKKDPGIEIIIISGYAHFDYAQTAIKFGVGDYLLKPINKTELIATLEKLKSRIEEKLDSVKIRKELLEKNEKDSEKIRALLCDSLFEGRQKPLSMIEMNQEYHLNLKEGDFQIFCMKMDGNISDISRDGIDIVMNKLEQLLLNSLESKCFVMLTGQKSTAVYGLINYGANRRDDVRRILKDCVNQLEYQKSLYGNVTFTLALSRITQACEELVSLAEETKIILQERFVKGTGRVIDHVTMRYALSDANLTETYLRRILPAIETLDVEEASAAADEILEQIHTKPNARGFEIFNVVKDCGVLFLTNMNPEQKAEQEESFLRNLNQCQDVNGLFEELKLLQERFLSEKLKERKEQTNRPIRQAKLYIQKHFSEPITQEEVAESVGLSSAYFSTLFKKEEGEGFAKYLINIRMEQAKVLLRETNASVAEICNKVGYNDVKHFKSTFEKTAGVKPSTYRKLYG